MSPLGSRLLLVSAFLICFTAHLSDCVQCRFDFWDDDQLPDSIHPATIRCQEGEISWHWVRSAVYIRPDPELVGSRLCLRITANGTKAVITHFVSKVTKERFTVTSPEPVEFCVTFTNGSVVYAEPASLHGASADSRLTMEYVVEREASDRVDGCARCSNKDFARLYCTGDFAVWGFVTSVDRGEGEHASTHHRMDITMLKVHHQSTPVFSPVGVQSPTTGGSILIPSQCVGGPEGSPASRLVTGEKRVFVGRFRFRTAFLQCSLGLEEFEALATRMAHSGTTSCSLR